MALNKTLIKRIRVLLVVAIPEGELVSAQQSVREKVWQLLPQKRLSQMAQAEGSHNA